jgi:predicted enzyme involved in methoxymalonyl-ACP biosynthesis
VSYSEADAERTKQYQVEAQRVSLQKTFVNEDDYLKSLYMVSVVEDFNKFNTPRVAQLRCVATNLTCAQCATPRRI